MVVLSCLVLAFLLLDMPCLYNIGEALILVCVPCSPKHPSSWHTSRGRSLWNALIASMSPATTHSIQYVKRFKRLIIHYKNPWIVPTGCKL